MKKFFFLWLLFVQFFSFAQSNETLYDFTANTISGNPFNLSDFAGKKVMVVNTATFCGFTNQYADLKLLYDQYNANNFEIIGFPCNDFGGQEPYDDSTILAFVTNTYHINFLMMSKINIAVPDTCDVYEWLQLQSRNGVANAPVTWNFHKYLIDEAGHWVAHYPSSTLPMDPAIVNWILSPNTTGITSPENNSVTLLTNPVSDRIRVRLTHTGNANCSFRLYSADGRVVKSMFLPALYTNLMEIPVADLAGGFYFLEVRSGNESETMKVLITK